MASFMMPLVDVELRATGARCASVLPQPWFDGDLNKDGAIDVDELRSVLRGLDPGLLRWAAELFQRLDADKDGRLSVKELQATLTQAPPSGAAKTPPGPAR